MQQRHQVDPAQPRAGLFLIVIRIEATRVIDGRAETDVRIFVLSRKLSPQALLETATCSLADRERAALAARRLVRRGRRAQPQGQWPRKHRGHSPARARRCPLLDQSKRSLTAKLKRTGWNDEFVLKLLSQML